MTSDDLEAGIRAAWDFADPEVSEARFGNLAVTATDPDEAAIWRTQVVRALGLRGEFAAAHSALDTIAGDRDLGVHAQARIAIERGRLINSSDDPAGALPLFAAAYELPCEAGRDGLAVDALHMSAIALGVTGDPDGATATNLTALDLAESSADPTAQAWVASLLNNLGWIRHEAAEYEAALELFERALVTRRADGSSAGQVLVAEWCVARTLRSLGRYEEALAIQLRLATEPEGADDPYVAEEIAACRAAL